MNRRDFVALGCLLPAAAFPLMAAPAPVGLSLNGAVNRAGRQRMLSQRSTKGWLMLVDGVLPDRAKSILNSSMRLFEQQLVELKSLLPTDEVRAAIQILESEWVRFRPLLADLRSDPKAMWTANESVLTAAQKLTVAYEHAGSSSAGHLVNLSGRQRMLSQRMAKAYFFRQIGVNVDAAREMLEASVREFAKAHEELKAAPQNTAAIKTELELVEQQWFFFRNGLSLSVSGDVKKAASDVATTSERILEQMDVVVAMYERIT